MDTKNVCRAIEAAIGFPKGMRESDGSWIGLQMHADGPRSAVFTIHALAAEGVRPLEGWLDAVLSILSKHKVQSDAISIQQLSTFEDVSKESARPCSALFGFMSNEAKLVQKFRNNPTTLIVAEVARKERLLLWFLMDQSDLTST